MADQTLPLNVSDEMKSDDERQNCVGMESDEELCSSSSDSAEKLYSSSATDACGDCGSAVESELRNEIINNKPTRKRAYRPNTGGGLFLLLTNLQKRVK